MDGPVLTFYGAAGTVTGSKYHLRYRKEEILLDAGLFQGLKALRLRNWETPFDPARLQGVVLSHAHIDHSGYLPVLSRLGFRGRIDCTSGTADLLRVMLADSAKLQEEDAAYANRKGYSKHHPALPLYTQAEVRRTLERLKTHRFGKKFKVTHEISGIFHGAGHILGAATVELLIGRKSPVRLVFSGDLGRWSQPIIRDPEIVPEADILLIESTYGDQDHPQDSLEKLARVIIETAERGGVLMIPAFAVGRTQELIWWIRTLEETGKIPVLPVILDSPMAVDVTEIYARHPEEYDSAMAARPQALRTRNFMRVESQEDSKRLNKKEGPFILISSSGMLTGGRILHHVEQRIGDERNTLLLAGFQAAGTRGRALQDGARVLRFFGREAAVRARVEKIDGLSAHADRADLLRWLRGFRRPPRMTYVVHGEPETSEAFARTIREEFHWNVTVAADGQAVDMTALPSSAAA